MAGLTTTTDARRPKKLGPPALLPRPPAILSFTDHSLRHVDVASALPLAPRAAQFSVLSPRSRNSLSHPHLRRRSSKPGLGAGPTPELRRLSVERAELESTKEGRKVYVKKSGLFFLSSKQEALDLNAAKQDAAVAAAAAALDLADADPGES